MRMEPIRPEPFPYVVCLFLVHGYRGLEIRIRSSVPLYYNYNKERNPQNTIGNYLGTYRMLTERLGSSPRPPSVEGGKPIEWLQCTQGPQHKCISVTARILLGSTKCASDWNVILFANFSDYPFTRSRCSGALRLLAGHITDASQQAQANKHKNTNLRRAQRTNATQLELRFAANSPTIGCRGATWSTCQSPDSLAF